MGASPLLEVRGRQSSELEMSALKEFTVLSGGGVGVGVTAK